MVTGLDVYDESISAADERRFCRTSCQLTATPFNRKADDSRTRLPAKKTREPNGSRLSEAVHSLSALQV